LVIGSLVLKTKMQRVILRWMVKKRIGVFIGEVWMVPPSQMDGVRVRVILQPMS